MLDETDSGLDIDALKVVATGRQQPARPERAIVLVTHYQRMLDYVVPDSCTCWHGAHRAQRRSHAGAGTRARGYDWISEQARLRSLIRCRRLPAGNIATTWSIASSRLCRRGGRAVAGQRRDARGARARRCRSLRAWAGRRPAMSNGATRICARSRGCRSIPLQGWRPRRAAVTRLPGCTTGCPARLSRLVYVDGCARWSSALERQAAARSDTPWPAEQRLGLLCDMFASESGRLAGAGRQCASNCCS